MSYFKEHFRSSESAKKKTFASLEQNLLLQYVFANVSKTKTKTDTKKNNTDSGLNKTIAGSVVSLCSCSNGNRILSSSELWKMYQLNLSYKLTESLENCSSDLQYLTESLSKLSSEVPKSCELWGKNSLVFMKSVANNFTDAVTEPNKFTSYLRHPTSIFREQSPQRVINISHPTDYNEDENMDKDQWAQNRESSELSGCCRSPVDRRPSPTGSIASTQSQSQLTPSRQLSDGERLKKVILELVDTERTYVKHLNSLLENYLEPLKNASFLSSAEVNALFGNIREIVAFQRLFLQALTEALDMEPAFHKFEHPYEFKNVLFSIGSAFLYYASQFKLYSSFCASHSKAQKVLHPSEGNQALQEFLASRNPRQQHSATLESYLIKPIQRILKYPLLLQQLKAITDPGSDEHRHLVEALKVMEKVAEHINEMQRIHEEYGAIFDHLFRQHQKSSKQVSTSSLQQPIDLSPGDLLYYGGVEWLNISDFLGKIKKGLELHAMCFVFKTAVVFLCKERLRQKKKLMGVPGKNSSSEVEIIRYQVLIPVTEVQVRASSMKDMDSHFLWELIHLKSQLQRRSEKVYHLSNSTSEFRNAFLKTIRQIIRESVRNMNIPANFSLKGSSQKPGSTNTLQPQRQAKKKQGAAAGHQSATLQRHSAGQIDYDNLESYDNVPETMQQQQQHHQQRGSIGTDSRSAAMSDGMDELSDSTTKSDSGMMVASATGADGGVDIMRSEGEDDEEEEEEEEEVLSSQRGGTHSASSVVVVKSGTLGRTPNHLSLSTTSTLSTGSTGSCARLIQASNQPAHYQPARSHAGSPVWKPRDSAFPSGGGSSGAGTSNSQTLPRSHKIATGREDHFHIYEEYGGNIYMSGGKKDQTGSSKTLNC